MQALRRRRALDAVVRRAALVSGADGWVLRGGVAAWAWWPERPADDVDLLALSGLAASAPMLLELPELDAGDGARVAVAEPPTPIWEETELPGLRVIYAVEVDGEVERVQLDLGVGDPLDPAPERGPVPVLEPPAPPMARVGPVQALSWKAHGLVEWSRQLGRSTRWRAKDLHDLMVLLERTQPSPSSLALAFSSRSAPLSLLNRVLDGALGRSRGSRERWEALRLARPGLELPELPEAVARVAAGLRPVLEVLRPTPAPFARFPVIRGREELLAAVGGLEGLVVHRRGDLSVLNAETNDDWPDPQQAASPRSRWDFAALRECRGLVFDATGALVARPYHKFFRLAEVEETQPAAIARRVALERPRALEKLDGAMITAGRVAGEVVWFSRRGPSALAEGARAALHPALHGRVASWIDAGWTPIFEWCARAHRIVLDYPEPRIVLTALRRRDTGEYMEYDTMVSEARGFEVVPDLGRVDDLEALVDRVRSGRSEGAVLRFDDGTMIKIKSDFYLRMHRVVESAEPERAIAECILWGELDALLARLPEQAGRLAAMAEQLEAAIAREAAWLDGARVERERIRALPRPERGRAMEALVHGLRAERALCLRAAQGGEASDAIVRRVARASGGRRWLR